MPLFDVFKLAKELEIRDGEIILMKRPVCFTLTHILADFQKDLIERIGFEKAYFQLYETNKSGSKKYNEAVIKKHGFKDKREVLNWQIKIITMGGWGTFEVMYIDLKENKLRIKCNNSPFPKIYGKSNCPVCILPTGFSAGGASANFGTDLDGLETKCVASGHPFCEIMFESPQEIKEKRIEQWKKLGLL